MFDNHTNLFCHAVIVGNSKEKKVERQSASACFTWDITWLLCNVCNLTFIDRSGAHHAHVKCVPGMGHIRQKSILLNWL